MAQVLVDSIISMAAELSREERMLVIGALAARDEIIPAARRLDPFGKFAHVPTSVDAFLSRKAAEIDLESR